MILHSVQLDPLILFHILGKVDSYNIKFLQIVVYQYDGLPCKVCKPCFLQMF